MPTLTIHLCRVRQAETTQIEVQYHCMCMQYSENACSVRTGYVFFGTLVIHLNFGYPNTLK